MCPRSGRRLPIRWYSFPWMVNVELNPSRTCSLQSIDAKASALLYFLICAKKSRTCSLQPIDAKAVHCCTFLYVPSKVVHVPYSLLMPKQVHCCTFLYVPRKVVHVPYSLLMPKQVHCCTFLYVPRKVVLVPYSLLMPKQVHCCTFLYEPRKVVHVPYSLLMPKQVHCCTFLYEPRKDVHSVAHHNISWVVGVEGGGRLGGGGGGGGGGISILTLPSWQQNVVFSPIHLSALQRLHTMSRAPHECAASLQSISISEKSLAFRQSPVIRPFFLTLDLDSGCVPNPQIVLSIFCFSALSRKRLAYFARHFSLHLDLMHDYCT